VNCGGRYRCTELCIAVQLATLPILDFGKHRGKRLGEVPTDYLEWMRASGPEEYRAISAAEIERRAAA